MKNVPVNTLKLLEAILQYSYTRGGCAAATKDILALACPEALEALRSGRNAAKISAIRALREAYPGLSLRICKDMCDSVVAGKLYHGPRPAQDCWRPA